MQAAKNENPSPPRPSPPSWMKSPERKSLSWVHPRERFLFLVLVVSLGCARLGISSFRKVEESQFQTRRDVALNIVQKCAIDSSIMCTFRSTSQLSQEFEDERLKLPSITVVPRVGCRPPLAGEVPFMGFIRSRYSPFCNRDERVYKKNALNATPASGKEALCAMLLVGMNGKTSWLANLNRSCKQRNSRRCIENATEILVDSLLVTLAPDGEEPRQNSLILTKRPQGQDEAGKAFRVGMFSAPDLISSALDCLDDLEKESLEGTSADLQHHFITSMCRIFQERQTTWQSRTTPDRPLPLPSFLSEEYQYWWSEYDVYDFESTNLGACLLDLYNQTFFLSQTRAKKRS